MPTYDIIRYIRAKDCLDIEKRVLKARIEEVFQVILSCFGSEFRCPPLFPNGEGDDEHHKEFLSRDHTHICVYTTQNESNKFPIGFRAHPVFYYFPVNYLMASDEEIKMMTFEKYGDKLAKYLEKKREDKDRINRKRAILRQLSPEDRELFE